MKIVHLVLTLALFLLIQILLSSNPAYAEVSGNNWRQLGKREQMMYLQGVMDAASNIEYGSKQLATSQGISLRDYIKKSIPGGMFAAIGCPSVADLPIDQKLAMINKQMADHPEKWPGPMALIIVEAFIGMCETAP